MNEARDDFETRAAIPDAGPRVVDSGELLRGAREICIRHGESLYTLRLTRQGKLILNKQGAGHAADRNSNDRDSYFQAGAGNDPVRQTEESGAEGAGFRVQARHI